MSIKSVSEIKKRLEGMKYSEIKAISENTGLSFETLKSIRLGRRNNPTFSTLETLSKNLFS